MPDRFGNNTEGWGLSMGPVNSSSRSHFWRAGSEKSRCGRFTTSGGRWSHEEQIQRGLAQQFGAPVCGTCWHLVTHNPDAPKLTPVQRGILQRARDGQNPYPPRQRGRSTAGITRSISLLCDRGLMTWPSLEITEAGRAALEGKEVPGG